MVRCDKRKFRPKWHICCDWRDHPSACTTHNSAYAAASRDKGGRPDQYDYQLSRGHVEAGDMVHDMMKSTRSRVPMSGSGWIANAGALSFAGKAVKERRSLPNTRFLFHQPNDDIDDSALNMKIQATQTLHMWPRFEVLFAKVTRQTEARSKAGRKRDCWLNIKAALLSGLRGRVSVLLVELS